MVLVRRSPGFGNVLFCDRFANHKYLFPCKSSSLGRGQKSGLFYGYDALAAMLRWPLLVSRRKSKASISRSSLLELPFNSRSAASRALIATSRSRD